MKQANYQEEIYSLICYNNDITQKFVSCLQKKNKSLEFLLLNDMTEFLKSKREMKKENFILRVV